MRRYAAGIGAAAAVFLLAAFLIWRYGATREAPPAPGPSATSTAQAAKPPPGWRTYRDPRYHFMLFYPNGLQVRAFEDRGSASTITFQDDRRGLGFQIFVAPYPEPQVSEARFRLDAPSGVREEPTTVSVDGATGAAFYGKDAALGDTREIWFIKDGLLYEATAPKAQEKWLQDIIATWKFL
jgi:hypothetical protein